LAGRARARCGITLVGAVVLLLLLRGPALASAAWGNVGALALRDGLLARGDLTPGIYPVYEVLDETRAVARAMQSLRRAVALDEDNQSARWALGRTALAVGDVKSAANVLRPLVERGWHNPLLYYDVLLALSYSGQPEQVIAWYESAAPLQYTQMVSDVVALAYLDLTTGGPGDKETGRQGQVRRWLERALTLRPGDLYANYHLWKQAQQGDNLVGAAVYSETLVYFPLEAVHPVDERLLNYAAEAIPAMLEDGLWDREKTLNVVAFLVWQYDQAMSVERLIERLIERYPNDADWPFYLAELYHRRGGLEQAEAAYRQVLAVEPGYAQAYLRLGTVAEAKAQSQGPTSQEWLREAAGWYEQYHAMAPDDWLGSKRLAEVYEVLGRPEAAVLREALVAKTDARHIVAEMLGVPVESVELGPNLVGNGGFEKWEGAIPTGWQFGCYLGQGGDGGLYAAGKDALAAEREVSRIITLWGGLMPDGTTTYAEYVGDGFSVTGTQYLISLYYRVWHFTEGGGLIFLGDYAHLGGVVLAHEPLPLSDGQWRVLRILADGPAGTISVVPLVRNWGIGQLWAQAFEVRPVVYEH